MNADYRNGMSHADIVEPSPSANGANGQAARLLPSSRAAVEPSPSANGANGQAARLLPSSRAAVEPSPSANGANGQQPGCFQAAGLLSNRHRRQTVPTAKQPGCFQAAGLLSNRHRRQTVPTAKQPGCFQAAGLLSNRHRRQTVQTAEISADGSPRATPVGPATPLRGGRRSCGACLSMAVTEEDIEAIAKRLVEQAKAGDVAAARLLLSYAIGQPTEAVDPDTLDQQEWAIFRQVPVPAPRWNA